MDAQRLAKKMNKGSGQSPKHSEQVAQKQPFPWSKLTWQLQRMRELRWEKRCIVVSQQSLKKRQIQTFVVQPKPPFPLRLINLVCIMKRRHIGGQKKVGNWKATSPYLSWMVYSSLTNMVSATSALPPTFLSLFRSYFICIAIQKATEESPCCSQSLERPTLMEVKGQVLWAGVRWRQATLTKEIIENTFSLPNGASTRSCPSTQEAPSYFGDSNFLFLKTKDTFKMH